MPAPHDALPTDPRAAVLRRDRAVDDDAWIERLLAVAPVGSLATVADGSPFLNVNLFWFDPARRAVYVHTARRGRTRSNVEAAEAQACFAVQEMGRLLPAATALEFGVEYAGVVAFGPIAVVDDPDEAAAALQALLDKYAPHLEAGRDYQGVTAEELARTTVMRLDVAAWSGKRKVVDAGFPGAFAYAGASVLDEDRG
ncbi:MAG: pyridoxamine 5'-phosphate oxidase family protein [Trueperaceae bacterium]|nr:pyridoxamine 5'-phosphate oxidase family protein [Trueperaceae bacterium]